MKVQDIGQWHAAYDCLVYAAIAVNCGLMVRSGQLGRLLPFLTPVQAIMAGVLIEHLLIAIKIFIENRRLRGFLAVLDDDGVQANPTGNGLSTDNSTDDDKCD